MYGVGGFDNNAFVGYVHALLGIFCGWKCMKA